MKQREEDVDMEKSMDMDGSGQGRRSSGKEEVGKRRRRDADEENMKNTMKWLRMMEKEDADMGVVDEEEEQGPRGKKVNGFEVNEEALEEAFEVEDLSDEESGWTEDELDKKLTEEGTREEE